MHALKKSPSRIHVVALLTAALTCAGAVADEPIKTPGPGNFAYRQPLEIPIGADGSLVRLPLTPSVYHSLTRADLGDLRVFNASGQMLPYALIQPPLQTVPATQLPAHLFPLPMRASGQDLQQLVLQVQQLSTQISLSANQPLPPHSGGYVIDLSDAVVDGKSPALDNLTLDWVTTPGGLSQAVEVRASDDLTQWQHAGAARIVQLDYLGETLRQDSVALNGIHARYLLLSWDEGQAPPQLTAVHVRSLATPAQPALRLTMSIPRDPVATGNDYMFDAGNPIGAEEIGMDLPRGNLIIASVLVRDDPAQAWRPVAKGDFFHLMQGPVEMTSPPLVLGGTVHARYWLVQVDPRSSKLQPPPAKLDLTWTPEELVFLAQPPGPYELAFGNPSVAPALLPPETLMPGYAQNPAGTLARLGSAQIAGDTAVISQAPHAGTTMPAPVSAADVALKPVNPSALLPAAPVPPWRDWRTWLAWGALLLGVALLGWMAWRLVKQMRAPV